MRKLKHLPLKDRPAADTAAFAMAYEPGDLFDETGGPGAHHSEGWRRMVRTGYRRWLGFLKEHFPADLLQPPAERITLARVRAFVGQLSSEVRPSSVAIAVGTLCAAARLIAVADGIAVQALFHPDAWPSARQRAVLHSMLSSLGVDLDVGE